MFGYRYPFHILIAQSFQKGIRAPRIHFTLVGGDPLPFPPLEIPYVFNIDSECGDGITGTQTCATMAHEIAHNFNGHHFFKKANLPARSDEDVVMWRGVGVL